jgi:hypothetical protein
VNPYVRTAVQCFCIGLLAYSCLELAAMTVFLTIEIRSRK